MPKFIRVTLAGAERAWVNPDRLLWIIQHDGYVDECRLVFGEHEIVDIDMSGEQFLVSLVDSPQED